MRTLLVVLASSSVLLGGVTARDVALQSIQNYDHDWKAALNYTYMQRDAEKKGTGTEISVSQVMTIDGTPYERLVARDGRSLPPDVEQKEQSKYQKVVDERAHETPEARAKRLADYEKQRQFLHEVPNAFNFALIGEDSIDGRTAYVVECTPKEDYVPQNSRAKMFKEIRAKLWIDKQDVRWIRAEATVMDTVSFGVILARIGKGAHIRMDQTRMPDGTWLPSRIDINGAARIMLVKNRELSEQLTYSDFRKVQPGEKIALARNSR